MAFQKIGVIPDKIILLETSENKSLARLEKNLLEKKPEYGRTELRRLSELCLKEYRLHIDGVKSVFKEFIYELDGSDIHQ